MGLIGPVLTRSERDNWDVIPGGALKLFETALGEAGILTCYDSEFPLLGRALRAVDVILVPVVLHGGFVGGLAGVYRRHGGGAGGAMCDRHGLVVGYAEWSGAVNVNVAMGGIFGPPDSGFPGTGVLADGQVLNRSH